MGHVKLPKEIRKSLNKQVALPGPAGTINLILRPAIRARRARKILMDSSRILEQTVREEVERIYITSLATAIGVAASFLLFVAIASIVLPMFPNDLPTTLIWLIVAGFLGLHAILFYVTKLIAARLIRVTQFASTVQAQK